jgi:hypothetical protein
MMLRNLKALGTMRGVPAPSVCIGSAAQVNVTGLQANVGSQGDPMTDGKAGARGPVRRGRTSRPSRAGGR